MIMIARWGQLRLRVCCKCVGHTLTRVRVVGQLQPPAVPLRLHTRSRLPQAAGLTVLPRPAQPARRPAGGVDQRP